MTEIDLTFEEILAIYKEFEKFSDWKCYESYNDDAYFDEDIKENTEEEKIIFTSMGEIENKIGEIYERGTHGVKRDFEMAAKYLEKANEHGNLDAKKMLAKKYYDGRGVEKDDGKALRLFLKVAEKTDDAESLKISIDIVKKYLNDDGTTSDFFVEDAVTEYEGKINAPEFLEIVAKIRDAELKMRESGMQERNDFEKLYNDAENGDIAALETIIKNDFEVPEYNLACSLCNKFARAGNIEAMRILGYINRYTETGIYWYEKYLEKATDAEKILQVKANLARAYCRNREYEKAFKLFQELLNPAYSEKLAAMYERGFIGLDPKVYILHLAEMYEKGKGVAQDLQKAASLYKQSAQQVGNLYGAIDKLLEMYLNYNSLTPDFEEVLRLYEENNHFASVGDMYYNGWGVEVSFQKAFQYYEKHIQISRVPYVIKKMIPMLRKGEGVEKDENRALKLLREIEDYYGDEDEIIRYHVISAYDKLDLSIKSEIEKIAANDAYINLILTAASFGERSALSDIKRIGWFFYKNGEKEKALRFLDIAAKNDCDF